MRIGIDIDDTLTDIKTFYNWKERYNYINEME